MNQAEINRIKRFAKDGDLAKFWEAYQANPKQLFSIQGNNPGEFSDFEWTEAASAYQIVKPAKKIFVQVGTRPSIFRKGALVTHTTHGDTMNDLKSQRKAADADCEGIVPKITWHPIQVVEVPSE